MHASLQERALRVDQKVALAAGNLFAAVVAPRPAHLSGLGRLAIDDGGARLALTADALAIAFAQDGVDVLPGAIPAPAGIVIEHGIGRWILVREKAPLHACS